MLFRRNSVNDNSDLHDTICLWWFNGLHRIIYLNVWFPVDGTVWEGVGGVGCWRCAIWVGFKVSSIHGLLSYFSPSLPPLLSPGCYINMQILCYCSIAPPAYLLPCGSPWWSWIHNLQLWAPFNAVLCKLSWSLCLFTEMVK